LAENKVFQAAVGQQLHPSVSLPITAEKYFRECRTFRARYRLLIAALIYVGATKAEAEDAIAGALEEVLRAWDTVDDPQKRVPKAALRHFYEEKTRGLERDRDQLMEKGAGTAEGDEDQQMSLWEDPHWVAQMRKSLTPKQRMAMTLITEALKPTEIADLLGRTPEAVRQRLLQAKMRWETQHETGGG
jgi:DNA-directed RNA polymerase specialized sigma24 family protein